MTDQTNIVHAGRYYHAVPSPINRRQKILLSDQCYRLLVALRNKDVTTEEAQKELNILNPSARIRELRAVGFPIRTDSILYFQWHRRSRRMAIYTLEKITTDK